MSALYRSALAEEAVERELWAIEGFAARIHAEWLAAGAAAVLACLILPRPSDHMLAAATLAIGALVAWIVVQDLRRFTIADGAVTSLGALALALRCGAGDPALLIVLDVALSGGVLLVFREVYFRRRGFDGLGLGDVKLAAAGGLLVGASAFAWVLLGASVAALAAIAVAAFVRRQSTPLGAMQKIAFGAFLAPALYIVWVVQVLPVLWPSGP